MGAYCQRVTATAKLPDTADPYRPDSTDKPAMSSLFFTPTLAPAFTAGLLLSLSLIVALGPQNAHVLRMGLTGQHVWTTIAVSIASDVALIGLGVLGLAQLGGMSHTVQTALVCGGIVFLLIYGWQALARFCSGASRLPDAPATVPMTRRQAVAAALAFAWLNPHAWLDTAVLIGSASLAWGRPGNTVFGLGAATASAVWFTGLGLGVAWLGQRLRSPVLWRALDGLVALMVWGTAGMLAWGLF